MIECLMCEFRLKTGLYMTNRFICLWKLKQLPTPHPKYYMRVVNSPHPATQAAKHLCVSSTSTIVSVCDPIDSVNWNICIQVKKDIGKWNYVQGNNPTPKNWNPQCVKASLYLSFGWLLICTCSLVVPLPVLAGLYWQGLVCPGLNQAQLLEQYQRKDTSANIWIVERVVMMVMIY